MKLPEGVRKNETDGMQRGASSVILYPTAICVIFLLTESVISIFSPFNSLLFFSRDKKSKP